MRATADVACSGRTASFPAPAQTREGTGANPPRTSLVSREIVLRKQCAAIHMDLKPLCLPIGRADLCPLQAEPSAFVETSQNAVAEIDVLLAVGRRAVQAACSERRSRVRHAWRERCAPRSSGADSRDWAGSADVAAVLYACVFVEKRLGQKSEDAANAFFVVGIVLPMARLLGGRVEQMVETRSVPLADRRRSTGARRSKPAA